MRRKIWAGCFGWMGCLAASAALAADPLAPPPSAPPAQTANIPPVLRPPDVPSPSEGFTPAQPAVLDYPFYAPLGFTGPSRVPPPPETATDEYIPLPDRWRLGFPAWDRYGKGHPFEDEYPFVDGSPCDPYHQNVLKGDYPIFGQHTFLNITGSSFTVVDGGETPINATGFESTARPHQTDFFGSPNFLVVNEFLSLSFDLFQGDAAFRPVDWRVRVTPIFNVNTLNVDELGVVGPNILKGTQRDRSFLTLEEYFVEAKIADLSPEFDFISARVGSQFFNNDFRGFLFIDTNRAVRIFGTENNNQDQFNLAVFRQAEKDTNSGLNTFDDRGQDIVVANWFHQDFIVPGYTVEASVLYNHDPASFTFDRNGFLVRPDPVGTFTPQREDIVYLGLGSDGHIDRFNITTQVYWALGQEGHNNLAGQQVEVDAWMAAAELSYDRDWARFRTSFFYSSGDHNNFNSHATGFDSVMADPNFAGGEFSYWQRQEIKLFGVDLKNPNSLIPDLRSSQIEGQSNFVNPGLLLFNLGVDFELTPKIKLVNNCNFLWFETTKVLEQFTFDGNIGTSIGTDLSSGIEYRPLLTNNVIMTFGVATLIPGGGLKELFDFESHSLNPLVAGFAEIKLTY
jgi:hypothetical protein